MKSAYELAMERLAASDPDTAKPLTKEKKAKLAEVDTLYQGKIAEREIFLKQKIDEARKNRDRDAFEELRPQLASERKRLEQECEEEKDRVRKS